MLSLWHLHPCMPDGKPSPSSTTSANVRLKYLTSVEFVTSFDVVALLVVPTGSAQVPLSIPHLRSTEPTDLLLVDFERVTIRHVELCIRHQ